MRIAASRPLVARRRAIGAVSGLIATVGVAAAAVATVPYHVSQKGRAFLPASLRINAGDAVDLVNDDGDLLHHAYLENDAFSFDTGDQEPGSHASIVFPKAGTFTVMCGIHPKMKLVIRVE